MQLCPTIGMALACDLLSVVEFGAFLGEVSQFLPVLDCTRVVAQSVTKYESTEVQRSGYPRADVSVHRLPSHR